MTDKELNTGDPVAWGWKRNKQIYDVICPEEHARAEGSYTEALYSQDYVTQLLREIEVLKKQLEPALFWNNEDPEQGYHSIDDVVVEEYQNVFDMDVGHEIEIQQAILLQNVKVRITAISDDGDLEWEIVNDSE